MRNLALVFFAVALLLFVGVRVWGSPSASGDDATTPGWAVPPGYSPHRLQVDGHGVRLEVYRPSTGASHPAVVVLPAESDPSPIAKLRYEAIVHDLLRDQRLVAVLRHHDVPSASRATALGTLIDQLELATVARGACTVLGFGAAAHRLALERAATDDRVARIAILTSPTAPAVCATGGADARTALAAAPEPDAADAPRFHAELDANAFWTEWLRIATFVCATPAPVDRTASASPPGRYVLDRLDFARKGWAALASARIERGVAAEARLLAGLAASDTTDDQAYEATSEELETAMRQTYSNLATGVLDTSTVLVLDDDASFTLAADSPTIDSIELGGTWTREARSLALRSETGGADGARWTWFGDEVLVEHPDFKFPMVLRRE